MNHPINVIHTLGFPLDFNGNLTRVLGEAIQATKLGCEVHIIVSDYVPIENLRHALESGVRIHSRKALIPSKKIGWRINNIIPLGMETLRILRKVSNSILHIAAPTPVTKPLTVSEICKFSKRPSILDLHDPWSADPFSFNFILRLQTKIMRRVIKSVKHVIVAHTALVDLVRKINSNVPVEVIPYGVDIQFFGPRPPNPLIAKSLGIHNEDKVIAFSGHILEDKGLDILVRSAQTVREKYKDVKFLVVGDGPARPQAESLVDKLHMGEVFRFTGFVPQELVIEYLSLADVCVAPYKSREYFKISLPETPLKVVEYMALGKPVIMSRISDENVITWSGGGVLVMPGNASELSSAIINLIEEEELRKTLGEKGRRYIEENLSWEKIARRLVEIYQSVLSS